MTLLSVHRTLWLPCVDNAAGEACPLFFWSGTQSALGGLVDPSALSGSEVEIQAAFDQSLAKISERVQAFFLLCRSILERH